MTEIYVASHMQRPKIELKKPLEINKETIDSITIKTNTPYGVIDGFEKINTAKHLSFRKPTIIQKYAIPIIMHNHPLLCRAPTGMGKTLCFLLPLIENTKYVQDIEFCVICPTRELCDQIQAQAEILVGKRLKIECLYGQSKYLKSYRHANIIIATPGRLLDLLGKEKLNVSTMRSLVLDEADRLLSMGFKDDIKKIKSYLPKDVNCFLFSATYTDDLKSIIDYFLPSNKCIVEVENETVDTINQEFHKTTNFEKDEKLKRLLSAYNLNSKWRKKEESDKILIFVERKKTTEELATKLRNCSHSVITLHGDIDQVQRTANLSRFRSGLSPIMIATSVAARGIDINDIKYVINYDFPMDIKEYIHRIGRTGRQGKKGTSISFLTDSDLTPEIVSSLLDILKESNNSIPEFLTDASNYKRSDAARRKANEKGSFKSDKGRPNRRDGEYIKNTRTFDPATELADLSISKHDTIDKPDSDEELPGMW